MFIQRMKENILEEKGAVAVLMTLAVTALIGMLALVVDIGVTYIEEARIVNAVDAAALAGIQGLPDSSEAAYQLAESYAVKNGVSLENVDIQVDEDNKSINVQATRHVNYFFAQVLGYSSTDVQRSAMAKVAPVSSVVGIAPFSIEEQELYYNEEYLLKRGAGGQPGGAHHCGWFGALRLGGNDANTYRENIKYGYQEEIKIGDILNVKNGTMSGPTSQGVQFRIEQCKHTPVCTSESYELDCSRLIIVPVVEACGNKDVEVKGFAMVFLEGVDGQGNENNVWGKFVRTCISGEASESIDADYGVYCPRLTR
ncbi:MAG: pilus assembly protein [Clostridia bacterium]|nr:pilus assembly protein [Clostridia bacterium]MDD4048809.1 pilus assembly protein [Clostridia bacterium]